MLSSEAETAPAIWAALARLRDVSRLVLVAIEQDDLAQVNQLAREADTLVAGIQAYQDSDEPLCVDARDLIEQISAANRRIVEGLRDRMQATSDELVRTRESRARLKVSKPLPRNSTPTLVDRTT